VTSELSAHETLERVRLEIEQVDRRLVDLIAQRVRLARQVGELKRHAGLPTLDPAREASVVRRASVLARESGLMPEDVREIYWHVIGLCRRAQSESS
jgi:chorismate mutase